MSNNINLTAIETKEFLKGTAKQFNCNLALTIQPNSDCNTISGLQNKMGMIEDNINLRFFTRKNKSKSKFFYIATVEHNTEGGYHLHLALSVPENIKDWFMRLIERIIKHKNNLPKSSVEVKEIYDLDGWMDYITKDFYFKDSFNNYFFNNEKNIYINNKK